MSQLQRFVMTILVGILGTWGHSVWAVSLPGDWLLVPTNESKNFTTDPFEAALSAPTMQADQQVEELFALSHQTIEAFQSASTASDQASFKSNEAPWRLTGMVTAIGVSASGGIGLVGLSGASAVEVNWRRKEVTPAARMAAHSQRRSHRTQVPLIELNRFLSPQALAARADTLATLFSKTRRTLPHDKLKQRFYDSLLSFQQVMSGLELSTSGQWRLSAVGIALGVSASGAINIVTAGGEAQIVLGWVLDHAAATTESALLRLSPRASTPLQRVLAVVAEDLSLATQDLDRMDGFKATSLEIGLSVSAEGTIGVATVGAEAGIVAQLTKETSSPAMKMVAASSAESIEESEARLGSDLVLSAPMSGLAQSLVAGSASDKGLRDWIAERRAHRYERISRKKFRTALERAFRMGQYFAARAARHEARMSRRGGRWEVGGLTLGLELSLDGSVGIAQVSGTTALEVEFERE